MKNPNLEIERKWLMDGFPDLPLEREEWQTQGYLSLEPVTVRIRKTEYAFPGTGTALYQLTVKGQGGLARTEVELDLDEARYLALSTILAAPSATKRLRRYRLPDGKQLECSLVDEGRPTAFYYAEVEFGSEEEALAFTPPAYLGREVTGVPGWSMAEYCRRKGNEE